MRDWYRVIHLMLTSKKGMSALQIMRFMGFGSHKTAWMMCHKVRTALIEDIEQLGGHQRPFLRQAWGVLASDAGDTESFIVRDANGQALGHLRGQAADVRRDLPVAANFAKLPSFCAERLKLEEAP